MNVTQTDRADHPHGPHHPIHGRYLRRSARSRAGDIIGLYEAGNLQIGDNFYTGNAGLQFKPLTVYTGTLS